MKKVIIFFIIVSGIYLVYTFSISYKIVGVTYKYVYFKESAIKNLNFENTLLEVKDYVRLKRKWNDLTRKAQTKIEEANRFNNYVSKLSIYFIFSSLLYLVFVFFVFKNHVLRYTFLIISISLISLLCLYLGILAPMIEIEAFKKDLTIKLPVVKDFVFSGDMYFYYQCKSVTDIIALLFQDRNFIVGISILLFSIIFPLSKTALVVLVLFKNKLYLNPAIKFIVANLGKWSMADVFVVACYLSFLSFRNISTGIDTESSLMAGLYYFLAFCIFSNLSSVIINKHFPK